jgi:NTE family protein
VPATERAVDAPAGISVQDLAVAIVDALEHPRHLQKRFTVANGRRQGPGAFCRRPCDFRARPRTGLCKIKPGFSLERLHMATTHKSGARGPRAALSVAEPSNATVPAQVVLVFQGGGALGAYQAGVYQALHAAGMEPDWVIGTSIGAINAALLAGNPPEQRLQRLRTFWRSVEQHAGSGAAALGWPALARATGNLATFACGIPAFFRPNPLVWLGQRAPVGLEQAAYYSTNPLRALLGSLLDLDYLNAQHMRVALGAVRVSNGAMRYFDSRIEPITVSHILASGALPPAFGAVRVEDDYYWDGGIYSNTPIEAVLNDHPRCSSLIFAVDLWDAEGPLPQSLWQVEGKQKDICYASRANSHLAEQQQIHHLRHVIAELERSMPDALRATPAVRQLASCGCRTTMHIARLASPDAASEDPLKDVDFSPGTLRRRWRAGVADAQRMLMLAPWAQPVEPMQGVVIHAASPG